MTVLVGLLCQDGVVIGSDSSATFAAGPNLSTIEQPVRKTFIVDPDLIFAVAGAAGLGQRLEHILRQHRQPQPGQQRPMLPSSSPGKGPLVSSDEARPVESDR